PLVGVRSFVGKKSVNLGECRRQAGQVEAQAAKQDRRVGFGRRREFFFFQTSEHEIIKASAGPRMVFERWKRRSQGPDISPMLFLDVGRPGRALLDPAL